MLIWEYKVCHFKMAALFSHVSLRPSLSLSCSGQACSDWLLHADSLAMAAGNGGSATQRLVQYVVVRGDLQKALGWPLGALVAQACHAATASIHLHYSHPHTGAYLQELDRMHKVVLEAPDEAALVTLADKLKQENVDHKVWIEQPENIATCIALRPYPKEEVQQHFKKLKLLK